MPLRQMNWAEYPKLAAWFEHRPRVNVYWVEFQRLLDAAYAEGVRDGAARESGSK